MRTRVLALASILSLSLAASGAFASHGGPDDGNPMDWARGGGQVALDPENLERAGDTLAFTAQVRPPAGSAEGRVQYVQTSEAGQDMELWNGRVDCLVVDGNAATIGGTILFGRGVTGNFAIRVTDNGTPDEGDEYDVILLSYGDDTAGDCEEDDFEDLPELKLARGNVTVHDAS